MENLGEFSEFSYRMYKSRIKPNRRCDKRSPVGILLRVSHFISDMRVANFFYRKCPKSCQKTEEIFESNFPPSYFILHFR